jgi:hypothetical protein
LRLDEPPVFFLDRTFGRNELARMLRQHDFILVTMFEEFGEADSRITDPTMIYDCGLKNRVLLTADKELPYLWAREMLDAKIAVFVVTNNNEGPQARGPRIVHAKRDILRELRRRERPFAAKISTDGRVTQVRIYNESKWVAIEVGKKNPPHVNRQKLEKTP